jgi:predicted MPP superfamily phosphohydrolase
MSRAWLRPPPSRTIHFISDTHWGGAGTTRKQKTLADIQKVGAMAALVHCGDMTEELAGAYGSGQDALAQSWWTSLPGTAKHAVLGNHDIWDNVRTPTQWAAAHGQPTDSYTVDLGFVKLIMLYPTSLPSGNNTGHTPLTSTQLTWLTTQLQGTKPCIVVFHWPLYNTAVGSTATYWTTTEASFYAVTNADILAVLDASPNAKLWVAGHTHCPTDQPGVIKTHSVGTRNILHLAIPAIHYAGRTREDSDPMWSYYLTCLEDGSFQVRVRNHGAGVWDGISTTRITTVTL